MHAFQVESGHTEQSSWDLGPRRAQGAAPEPLAFIGQHSHRTLQLFTAGPFPSLADGHLVCLDHLLEESDLGTAHMADWFWCGWRLSLGLVTLSLEYFSGAH